MKQRLTCEQRNVLIKIGVLAKKECQTTVWFYDWPTIDDLIEWIDKNTEDWAFHQTRSRYYVSAETRINIYTTHNPILIDALFELLLKIKERK